MLEDEAEVLAAISLDTKSRQLPDPIEEAVFEFDLDPANVGRIERRSDAPGI